MAARTSDSTCALRSGPSGPWSNVPLSSPQNVPSTASSVAR